MRVGPIFHYIVSASIMWEWSQTLLNRRPIHGSVQDCSISTANALDASALAVEILQFYTKPSTCNLIWCCTVKSQSSGKSSLFYSYASIDIKASTQMTFYCFSFKCVTWVGIDFKFEGYCIKTECMASIYVVEIGADFTLCWCSA